MAFTRKNIYFVANKEPSFIRNPPRFSRRDFDELAPSFRMGKVGWDDYRRKIKKKGGKEKESTRRERQESAKGGRGGEKRETIGVRR